MVSQLYKLGTKLLTLKPKLPYIGSFFRGYFSRIKPSFFLGILLPFMCSGRSSFQTFAIMSSILQLFQTGHSENETGVITEKEFAQML